MLLRTPHSYFPSWIWFASRTVMAGTERGVDRGYDGQGVFLTLSYTRISPVEMI